MVISVCRHFIFRFSNSHELIRGSNDCGIMFVTNWLTWNTEMMQANCSTPRSSLSGLVFTFFSFFNIQHQCSLHCGQWHSKQSLGNSEPGSISSELETLQIPAGLQGTLASCPLYRYPPVMPCWIIWFQPEMVSAEERFPATGPLWVDYMSLPVGLCGLESGNILTPTLHASSPLYACRDQGW